MNADQSELQRQQWLVQTLFDRPTQVDLTARLSPVSGLLAERGLRAYTDHADVTAVRALKSNFPVLHALLGDAAWGSLALKFWRAAPPVQGDLAAWGLGLASYIACCEPLDEWPYLADCARLEWALSQAERAADIVCQTQTLHLMSQHEPCKLMLELHPGCAVVGSAYPVVTLWLAHQNLPMHSATVPDLGEHLARMESTCSQQLELQPTPSDHFEGVRTALQQGRAESAMVWRTRWRGQVQCIDHPTALWTQALLEGHSLGRALELAGEDFQFDQWLLLALQQHWFWRVRL
jgi:hypothetical protein